MGKHAKIEQGVVKPTLGNRINNSAKAISVLIMGVVGVGVSILSTLPANLIDPQVASWINTGLIFAGAAGAWLTTNGPKVGEIVDFFVEEAPAQIEDLKEQL